jgi:hypothetical protein
MPRAYICTMSRHEKLIVRLLSRSRNFTYTELRTLLGSLGYVETTKGKTSGSRVAFVNSSSLHIIRLHKPHPWNQLKLYQIDFIIEELKNRGVIP